MISTLFFKGAWKAPFNKSETAPARFYDTNGKAKGEVLMMHQQGQFPFAVVQEMKANVLELPYGKVA